MIGIIMAFLLINIYLIVVTKGIWLLIVMVAGLLSQS